jgi:hypothetical protein
VSTLRRVGESVLAGVIGGMTGARFRISSFWATATASFSGIFGLPNNGIRSVNRDVVALVMPVVMSPTTPMVVCVRFCGGAGTGTAEEDFSCGTTSSTDEIDIVGLRTSRWVGLNNPPCTFWGLATWRDIVGNDGGTLSRGICIGGSTVVSRVGGEAGRGSSFAVGLALSEGNVGSTSEKVFGGSLVIRVSNAG